MKRVLATTIFTFVLVCLTATTVSAQSPHYLKLVPTIDSEFDYNVSLKEAGLGTASSITYTLSANALFQAQCFTKKGSPVQGTVKSGSGTATSQTILDVRQGQVTGVVELGPGTFSLSFPGCTGSQVQKIISAQYTNVSLDDGVDTATGFADTCTSTGICLPDKSAP